MRILHPTDFSEPSRRAGAVAVALAHRFGGSILLLHVVEPMPVGERRPSDHAEVEERLFGLAAQMQAGGIMIDARVVEGYAEEAIAAEAKAFEATLIVLGTHGRPSPLRWLLGSVTERTLKSAEVPVLVIPGGGEPFTSWASGARRLSVLVGLESAHPSEPLLEVARQFLGTDGCDLLFVHVAAAALLEGRMHTLLMRSLRERLKDFESDGRIPIRLIAGSGSPGKCIGAFARDHTCDLAIVGVHPHLGFESPRTAEVARALLRTRIVPVLGVPLPMHPLAPSGPLPQVRSIIAATDLSELGNRAVAYAYALARAFGGAVTIVHVHETTIDSAPMPRKARADLELRLLSVVPDVADIAPGSTNVVVVEAVRPAQAIIETANHLGADLICIGSHGRSAVGSAILGSVAENVVRHFGKAVVLVR